MRSHNGVSVSDLPKIAAMIQSLDPMEQSNAVSKLRRLLSLESNPPIQEVINLGVVPLLVEFLKQHDRPEMQFESAWALTNIASGTTEHTEVVIRFDLVGHPTSSILTPALRAVGNIVTGNEQQTQLMLDLAVLPRLVPLLKHEKKLIRKETCWVISNITAGTSSQIQEVIDANVIPPLLFQLMSVEFDVRKEAAWAISNATSGGTTEQIKYLVQQGCIPPLVKLLDVQDPRIINVSLDALENILRAGEADMSLVDTENRMARYIEEADGVELIQNLQFHQEEDIYEKSVRIIQDYFDGEDEEDFDIAPDLGYGDHQL
ncbi:Importin alpha-2 subunit [Phytophthora palmivora]|uniref:Importin alpha-2 subunit n=1 Tax=Phytophthora palmivora TaxID=4796 RepID=A0A2P4XUK7_9STRA|nr:Importin alpha-2 subunit [Phytophthora palmivora]